MYLELGVPAGDHDGAGAAAALAAGELGAGEAELVAQVAQQRHRRVDIADLNLGGGGSGG